MSIVSDKPRFDLKTALAAMSWVALWLGYYQALSKQVVALDNLIPLNNLPSGGWAQLGLVATIFGIAVLFLPIILLTHYLCRRVLKPGTTALEVLARTGLVLVVSFVLFAILLPPY
ncbi:MAG: hypothetical protein AAGA92_14485 [Planctomycetota bacterium]